MGEVDKKLQREHYQLYYFAIIQIYACSSKDLPTVTNSSITATILHLLALFVSVKADRGNKQSYLSLSQVGEEEINVGMF